MTDPLSFTPSELVVLFGEQFAEEGGMLTAKEEALVSRRKVSAEKLAHAAVAAALLASERAGVARLDPRQETAMFGLMNTQKLYLAPGAEPSPWPEGTLEAQLAEWAASGLELASVLETIIGGKSHNPSQRIVGIIKAGMAGRDLMDVAEHRMFGLISTAQFVLREEVRAAALRVSPQPVLDLLRETQRGRPQLWELILKQIRAAVIHPISASRRSHNGASTIATLSTRTEHPS